MVNAVNPPPHLKIPKKILEDPALRQYFQDLEFILFQLYQRTGGGNDLVAEGETNIMTPFMIGVGERIEELEAQAGGDQSLELLERLEEADAQITPNSMIELEERIEELESQIERPVINEREVVAIIADFTTTGSQTIICNNTVAIDITLNPSPDDLEKVTISRRDGPVTILGDVNGATSTTILFQYDSPTLIYTIDANEWSIV